MIRGYSAEVIWLRSLGRQRQVRTQAAGCGLASAREYSGGPYLDLAVEAQGYVYVLYYTGSGGKASDYQVDLYEPDGTFLVATPNVAATGLTVNLLRNMFTLNYEQILGPGSRVQPSVSMWLPPAPAPSRKTAQA